MGEVTRNLIQMAKNSFFPDFSSWFNNMAFEKREGNYVYTVGSPNLSSNQSVFQGGYSESNMMLLFQVIPEYFFPVNAIAGRVKNGVFSLVDKDGAEVTDNKLWNVFKKRPNWEFDFDTWVWHAVMDRLVTGNRYGYVNYPTGMKIAHRNIPFNDNNASCWLLPPHYVQIHMKEPRPSYLTTMNASEYISHYHYTGDTMGDITPDKVVHDIYKKVGDFTDIVRGKGVSVFQAGQLPMSNILSVYQARKAIYVNQGPLGAWVSLRADAGGPIPLTPDEKLEAAEDLQGRYGITGGRQSIAISNMPLKFEKTGATISELEPFKETEASAAALCGIVNVPTSLMPKGQDAKFANLDIAERNLYENVIFNEAEMICNFITKLLRLDELGYKIVVNFDHITCLQDDAMKFAQAGLFTAEASITLYENGAITRNEQREMINQDPLDGGDEFKADEGIVDTSGIDPNINPADLPPDETDPNAEDEPIKAPKVWLSQKCRDYLSMQPETGMNYHIATVFLSDKTVLKNRIILDGTHLKLDKGEEISKDDIDAIVVTGSRKMKAPRLAGTTLKTKKKNYFSRSTLNTD